MPLLAAEVGRATPNGSGSPCDISHSTHPEVINLVGSASWPADVVCDSPKPRLLLRSASVQVGSLVLQSPRQPSVTCALWGLLVQAALEGLKHVLAWLPQSMALDKTSPATWRAWNFVPLGVASASFFTAPICRSMLSRASFETRAFSGPSGDAIARQTDPCVSWRRFLHISHVWNA